MRHRAVLSLHRHRPREGFTIIELLVALVIISLLVALLLPAIGRTRETARRHQCLSHMHNLGIGLTAFDGTFRRLPASGNWGHDAHWNSYPLHTWAVAILPQIEQAAIYNQWHRDESLESPTNEALSREQIPLYQCPSDISLTGKGDISYAVCGGVGYTNRHSNGTRDVPVNMDNDPLDLNGDGVYPHLPGTDSIPTDRELFKRMGLFFMETWNTPITKRTHALADIMDGQSQTLMLTENYRAGSDPRSPRASFADPDPLRCAVYYKDPCDNSQNCRPGHVHYGVTNQGVNRINQGLLQPEGKSPVANSFHPGGVNALLADGSGRFLNERIDGPVLAALFSPQGQLLAGLPLEQVTSHEF
ncbi:MAG: DUF1559 domain-containing protein [Planctomycetota bacterium]|nr:MAG: DUF1559 domain-containing protein [Planctomycetota bacterium]